MQIYKNATKTAFSIVLALLMASFTLVAIPVQPVEAQLAAEQPVSGPLPSGVLPYRTTNTRAALSFRPTTIGVGQTMLVNFWINPALPSNNVFIPKGFIITITNPDGAKEVRTMSSEPATAANWFEFVPDMTGEWKMKLEFIGTYFPAGRYLDGKIITATTGGTVYTSCYYRPSSTEEQTFTVQTDFVWSWPLSPLPNDYWTRPASLNNRGWWPGLGNYPPTGYNGYVDAGAAMWDSLYPDTSRQYNALADFTPYVQAPNSPHIVWKRQDTIAGLIGGPAGQYGSTSSPSTPDLVYAGRCYDTRTVYWPNGSWVSVAECYDLRTGKMYYQIPGGITPNLIAYIRPEADLSSIAGQEIADLSWSAELLSISGSYLRKIDPNTGALTGNYSIAPLSGGTFHNQINGYVLNIQDLGAAAGANRYRLINWTTRGTTANLTTATATRIVSNTTYERSSLPTLQDFSADMGAVVTSITDGPFTIRWRIGVQIFRLSTGALLQNMTTTEYPDILYHPSPVMMDHGKVAVWASGGYFIFFDGYTGKWFRGETTDYPWSELGGFGAYAISSGYGLVMRYAYDGVYAYNWTDGSIAWKFMAPTPVSFETPYITNGTEHYSFNSDGDIADGKLYVVNSEHTTTWPITRGWNLNCVNITTGELIWKLNNPMSTATFADGYITAANSWDGTMYVIGKGESITTVTASPKTFAKGAQVLIEGTVMDQSPAQPGTPCVSQKSMEQQMEYLHLQMPIGGLFNNETITGVPVALTAIGSDGTAIDIGTATTNGYSGAFNHAWTPPAEGTYEIIASFTGDESYGSSMSTTAISVGPAPEPIQFPEQATPPDYTMTIVSAGIAIIVAVAIVGLLLAVLILRKR